jgi:hypothetical protein
VKFMVQTLATAGELQPEPTYDGLRAAEAKGNKGGRRPAIAADTTDTGLLGRVTRGAAVDHDDRAPSNAA